MTVSFFTHTDWFYAVNPFCSSLNCCFRLQITVHRLAVLLTVFWRKKRAKSVSAEKWKSYECRSYLFSVSMKLQFHKTWITLTSNSKTLQIFFSCAYNTIYTFAKFLLRLQILFALAVLCTLSQILPYACKSLWRKINFIRLLLTCDVFEVHSSLNLHLVSMQRARIDVMGYGVTHWWTIEQ